MVSGVFALFSNNIFTYAFKRNCADIFLDLALLTYWRDINKPQGESGLQQWQWGPYL